MAEEQNNSVKTVGLMMAITFIGKALGLVREMFFAGAFGTGFEGDAFSMASVLPRTFLDIAFAAAISACFIPVFNGYLEKEGKRRAYTLANNFITVIIVATSALTVLSMIFSPQIIGFFAAGFDMEKRKLTSDLFRIMLPMVIISGVAFSLIGVLQSMGEFNIPAAMSIVSNGAIILYYIFLLPHFGVYGLAIVFLISWSLQVLIQIPPLKRFGFSYVFTFDLKDPGMREIGVLFLPVMVSTWVQPCNVLVNNMVASRREAYVAALSAANNLYSVITGVFVLSIANVIFPKLSRISAGNDDAEFGETLLHVMRALFFFLIPMTAGLIILSRPIVQLVYERGAFDAASTALTAEALAFYSVGILGFGLQTILSRGFYAAKDGKTPLITGMIAVSANLILSLMLIDVLGVGGPALASSISLSIVAVAMLYVMHKKNKAVWNKKITTDVLKMTGATVVMAAAVYFCGRYLAAFGNGLTGRIICAGVPALLGVCVYLPVAWLLGIDEARRTGAFLTGLFNAAFKRK